MITFNFEKTQYTQEDFGYEANCMWEVDCPFTCMPIGSVYVLCIDNWIKKKKKSVSNS